jgi:hypothetical protein
MSVQFYSSVQKIAVPVSRTGVGKVLPNQNECFKKPEVTHRRVSWGEAIA